MAESCDTAVKACSLLNIHKNGLLSHVLRAYSVGTELGETIRHDPTAYFQLLHELQTIIAIGLEVAAKENA